MSWLKKIFAKENNIDKEVLSQEEDMLSKLNASVQNCQEEIKKAENEKDQIRKWAIDAIRNTFEVPNRFWYEELKKYQEIKALQENTSIDFVVIKKCDDVIQGYLDEIELRNAKVKLYNGLIDNYQASKDKMLKILEKKENESIAQTKLQELEKHSRRLEQLQTNPENLNHIDETSHLDTLKAQVNEVYEDFEISEEVRDYVHNINQQFKSTSTGFSSKEAISEIEGLIDKIKNEK